MQSKSLLIAVAAFAVTATGVHAYGGANILNRAGLSKNQVEAIQEAQELKQTGNFAAARDKLADAGITEETLKSIHKAVKEGKSAMRETIESGDYEAFKIAIADSPLADIITTEEDFEQFVAAHKLRQAGEFKEAHEQMEGLGVGIYNHHDHKRSGYTDFLNELSSEQREALIVAKQANDRATIQAIFDEAGIESHSHRGWH